jgi:3-isopropylmalate/(R)-2-methylmalate dehydratase large subunit
MDFCRGECALVTYLYKNLAAASGNAKVAPGDEIALQVDLALGHDGTGPKVLELMKQRQGEAIKSKKVVFTLDHAFPAPTIESRKFQNEFTKMSMDNGFSLYSHGEGVLHQVIAERERLAPGMIVAGADGHVATAGAFGVIGFALSPPQLVQLLYDGALPLTVPEQLVIDLDGKAKSNVFARDIAMYLVQKYGDSIKGKAVLFQGKAISAMNTSEKMSLCNYLPEGGAATALVLPAEEFGTPSLSVNLSAIDPMIACPGEATRFAKVEDVAGKEVTMAIAGGCSSGRLSDMEIIADVLEGRRIPEALTFVITPASSEVANAMDKRALSVVLREAGAVIMPPGCGPCPGKHFGLLSDNDVAVTTTIRNTPGRIGSVHGEIYLASPLTVALTAVAGKITAPLQ